MTLSYNLSLLATIALSLNKIDLAKAYLSDKVIILKKLIKERDDDKDSLEQMGLSFYERGNAWLNSGDTKQAETYYKEGLQIFEQYENKYPEDNALTKYFCLFFEQLGICSDKCEELDLSKEYFEKCLKICSKLTETTEISVEFQLTLANAFANCNRFNEGLEIVNELVDRLPLTAQVFKTRVSIYSKMNKIDNALKDLNTMMENELFDLSIQNDPNFKKINKNPEFIMIIQSMQKKCDML